MQIHSDADPTLNREDHKHSESDNALQHGKMDFYLAELALIILAKCAFVLINEFYRLKSATNCVALDLDHGCQSHKNALHAKEFLRRAFSIPPMASHRVLCRIVREEMRVHGDCWPLYVFPYVQAWSAFAKICYGVYSKIYFASLCDLFAYCLLTDNDGAGNLCAFRLREILQGKNWIDVSLDNYAANLLATWCCFNFVSETDRIACRGTLQADKSFLALFQVKRLLKQRKYIEAMSCFEEIFRNARESTLTHSHVSSLWTALTVRTALEHLQRERLHVMKLRQSLKDAAVQVSEAKNFEEVDKIKDIAARLSAELDVKKENMRLLCQFFHHVLCLSTSFIDTTSNAPVEMQWTMRFLVLAWNAAFPEHAVAHVEGAWCQFAYFSATHLLPSPLQALALVFVLEHISANRVPLGITLLTVHRPLFRSAPEASLLPAWTATEVDPKWCNIERIKEALKAIPNLPLSLLEALEKV